MANKLIQDLTAGAFALTDLLEHQPIAGPPSLKGDINALITLLNTVYGTGPFLPLAGGTMTGAILFNADNTIDIGAAGATRPRTGYFKTSVISDLFAFTGDITTGIFLNGAGTLALKTQNIDRFEFSGTNFNLLITTGQIGWNADTLLYRDTTDTLALRRTTNASAFRWYRTFTDSSNYERGALQTAAGQIIIAAETAGTGTDDIDLTITPAGAGLVRFGTHSAVGIELVTGYITIKDAGGTSRKIAVIS